MKSIIEEQDKEIKNNNDVLENLNFSYKSLTTPIIDRFIPMILYIKFFINSI